MVPSLVLAGGKMGFMCDGSKDGRGDCTVGSGIGLGAVTWRPVVALCSASMTLFAAV